MAQKEPEKKIPPTAANATHRSANDAFSRSHHCNAHKAFFYTQYTVSIGFRRGTFSFWIIDVCVNQQ
eukprot:6263896-Ditylum_brightwellii.AAC.1